MVSNGGRNCAVGMGVTSCTQRRSPSDERVLGRLVEENVGIRLTKDLVEVCRPKVGVVPQPPPAAAIPAVGGVVAAVGCAMMDANTH